MKLIDETRRSHLITMLDLYVLDNIAAIFLF